MVYKPKAKKDMLLVFFIKCFIASLLDDVVVKLGYVKYPTRFKPNLFRTSVLFDYLLFPVACMYYNLLTKDSNIIQSLIRLLYLTAPMTALELWLEKNTNLIKYKKSWNWKDTFWSLSASFLTVRGLMHIIRRFDRK